MTLSCTLDKIQKFPLFIGFQAIFDPMTGFFDDIGWYPSIGDPSFMGWLTVGAYFFCAYHAFKVVKNHDRIFKAPIPRQRYLWLAIAWGMVALGFNKQLDLQTFFTASARYFAWKYDWYEHRRFYQSLFILAIAGGGFATAVGLFVYYFKVIKTHAIGIVGLCLLVVFVVARAASFHNVDLFLSAKFLGVKMNWVLELSGIVLVLHNARTLLRSRRPLIDIGELSAPPSDNRLS